MLSTLLLQNGSWSYPLSSFPLPWLHWKPPASFGQTIWIKSELFTVVKLCLAHTDQFECVNAKPLLPQANAPVVFLSGKLFSQIISSPTSVIKSEFKWHLLRIAFSNSPIWNGAYLPTALLHHSVVFLKHLTTSRSSFFLYNSTDIYWATTMCQVLF